MAENDGISEIQPKIKEYPLEPITEDNQFSDGEIKYLLNGGETSGSGSGTGTSSSGTDLSGPEISGTDYSSDDNFDADFIKQAEQNMRDPDHQWLEDYLDNAEKDP
jgi:hypothetical protein